MDYHHYTRKCDGMCDSCDCPESVRLPDEWQPIETAPKDGREQILLKVPYNQNGVLAWSNTWWTCGFSAENKPTHWKPATPSNAALTGATPNGGASG